MVEYSEEARRGNPEGIFGVRFSAEEAQTVADTADTGLFLRFWGDWDRRRVPPHRHLLPGTLGSLM
jgi:hypothetical protein